LCRGRFQKRNGTLGRSRWLRISMADEQKPEETHPGLKDDGPAKNISLNAFPDLPAAPIPTVSMHGPLRADKIAPRELEPVRVPVSALKNQSRRDFLLYGAGMAAAAFGFVWLLPDETRARLHLKPVTAAGRKARLLDRTISIDDDVAEALYSPTRAVPTYSLSQAARELRNNYDGQTPDPAYIADWHLTVEGLASGKVEKLTAQDIQN